MADDVPQQFDFNRAEPRAFVVAADEAGGRLDRFLADRLADFTRSAVQRLIKAGAVRVNGDPARPAVKLRADDRIDVDVPVILPPMAAPEDLPLTVLLEEPSFVVIDKAAGMAVHPGAGRPRGTVANAISFRYGAEGLGGDAYRPGIVHRLDLDTSGVMVIAKNEAAHAKLAAAFAERQVGKEYRALVFGEPPFDEDRVEAPLGRAVNDPKRMAVRFDIGRASTTDIKVLERLGPAAYVACFPLTGRTHQIRVHLQTHGHPILGDTMYARGKAAPVAVPRLMLHAFRLAFPHPETGARVEVEAALPADFAAVLDALRGVG